MSSLSQGTLKMLRTAQNLPLARLDRLRLSEPLQQESLSMLHAYGKSLFQRDIVSWRHLWRQPRRRS
jgi:DNA repair protein RecO (recombination protein O)